jgi:hypothetical protein
VLRVRGREITVEVNSQQRLTRLLDILRKVGGNPVVTSEKRIDPAQDFGWAAGQRASEGGAAVAAEGWENFWLDEKVPALLGRTPRQAKRSGRLNAWTTGRRLKRRTRGHSQHSPFASSSSPGYSASFASRAAMVRPVSSLVRR